MPPRYAPLVSDFSGDVASWVTGLGTFALAAFAAFDIRRSRADANAQRKCANDLEQAAEDARERAQAEQVVAWIGPVLHETTMGSLGTMRSTLTSAVIRNDSRFPIADVELTVTSPDGNEMSKLEFQFVPHRMKNGSAHPIRRFIRERNFRGHRHLASRIGRFGNRSGSRSAWCLIQ
jgi:hypothetical protein